MSVSGSSFPNDATTQTATVSVYGAELYFYSGVNVNRALSLTNTTVSGSGAVFNKEVNLTRSASKPNGTATTFAMSSSTFKNKLTSNGYNFDISSLYLEVPASYKNKEFANFKFQGGETVEGGSIYLYPAADDALGYWGTSVIFDNSGDAEVNVASSIYVGHRGSSLRGRQMSVKLQGNLTWSLYKGSTDYKVVLSPNSQFYSGDYGSGNYARIKYGSGKYWQKCTMRDHVRTPFRHTWWVPFKCKNNHYCEDGTASGDYMACSINKDKSAITLDKSGIPEKGRCDGDGGCSCNSNNVKIYVSNCAIGGPACNYITYISCE